MDNAPHRWTRTARVRRLAARVAALSLVVVAADVLPVPALASVPVATIEDRTPASSPLDATGRASAASAAIAADEPLALPASMQRAVEGGLDRFGLVGVSFAAPPAEPVMIRTRSARAWGPWSELAFDVDEAPDETGSGGRPGVHSAPVWVGSADGYELLAAGADGPPTVHLGREETRRVIRPVVRSGAGAVPGIYGRDGWNARPPSSAPIEADDLVVGFVHHSVTTNGYTSADVPSILRGIQSYHMDVNGWSDIGYNFAVDKFGGTWEAHAGGIGRAIIGGHAKGFNTRSVGVVMLGDYTDVRPGTATINAVSDLLAWRFAVAGTDPRGDVTYTTTSGSTKYAPNTTVTLNRISGHRDVGATSCPGTLGYESLDAIRSGVATRYPGYEGQVPTRWITSPTHRYTDLRGGSPSEPDIASTATGQLDLVLRGGDDQLWHERWDGSRFTGWRPLGGTLRSGAAVVGSPDGRLDVFARGTDDGVWTISRVDGVWSGWSSLGGQITATPDVARSADDSLVLVARATDGTTWSRTRLLDTWAPWTNFGGLQPAGSGPALGFIGPDRLDVFVRGLDDALWIRTRVAGVWGPWISAGGRLTSAPAVASANPASIDLVVRGGDLRLYQNRRSATGWSGWLQISKERVGVGTGMVSSDPGRLDVVITTLDNRVFQTWWAAGSSW